MLVWGGEPLRQMAGQGPSISLACGERSAASGRGRQQGGGPGEACVGVGGTADRAPAARPLWLLCHVPTAFIHSTAVGWLPTLGQRVQPRDSGHCEVTEFGFFKT